ncbi:hypothetical protein ACIBK9_45055 [Nonomuraea sp. NPDC050227]|uniref:hypothetical protein n=1 Tax=Nonomuraea sp. NPDC050227 TaxID=3364360 RepID=UPI00378972AB
MTAVVAAAAVRERRAPGWARRLLAGWLPAGTVLGGAAWVLLWCGVPAGELAAFGAYALLGVALPGTLLWRALTGGGRSFAEDVAAGLALGYAVEVLVYIPARAAGLPLLVLGWPVTAVALFLAVPRLRRHWRGRAERERMPWWCAWSLAGVAGYLLAFCARSLYRVPITDAYVDMPYHLALLGEVRNHVPPTLPSVLGERLSYHWFVYAEMAATSWVTGIEPVTLVYRLSTLPMTFAMVVLVAVLGRRLGGRWGAGLAAVGVTYFLFAPVLQEGVVFTSRSMFTAWASPTQTFGALLFAPVMLVLTAMRPRGWAAVAVLLLALTGAKATFLPLLLAGLVFVLVVRLPVERRLRREWLVPAAITSGCLLIAQFVVFGRGAQGTVVAPFATMRTLWGVVADVQPPALAAEPWGPVLVFAGVHLFCLLCVWGGVVALKARLLDPGVLLPVGVGLAGIGAIMVLGHPSDAQLYFLEGVRPYLSVAAVCGVVAAVERRRVPWAVVAGLAGAGAAVAVAASRLVPPGAVLVRVLVPYLVLAGVAVVVLAFRRRGFSLAVVALLAGYAVPTSLREVVVHVAPEPWERERLIPAGALEAGRWLRDHSAPGDVVATDLHCRNPAPRRTCDSRHFWVSGFTERRVLVEGWAYAESTLSRAEMFVTPYLQVPFADQARLADNDAAFREPSAANVRRLRWKYGVRWLFTSNDPALEKYAELRFRNADVSVYELTTR